MVVLHYSDISLTLPMPCMYVGRLRVGSARALAKSRLDPVAARPVIQRALPPLASLPLMPPCSARKCFRAQAPMDIAVAVASRQQAAASDRPLPCSYTPRAPPPPTRTCAWSSSAHPLQFGPRPRTPLPRPAVRPRAPRSVVRRLRLHRPSRSPAPPASRHSAAAGRAPRPTTLVLLRPGVPIPLLRLGSPRAPPTASSWPPARPPLAAPSPTGSASGHDRVLRVHGRLRLALLAGVRPVALPHGRVLHVRGRLPCAALPCVRLASRSPRAPRASSAAVPSPPASTAGRCRARLPARRPPASFSSRLVPHPPSG